MSVVRPLAGMTLAMLASGAAAQSTPITETASSFSFNLNGAEYTVSRSGIGCPASCIQPMQVAIGVETLGELEVVGFMQRDVSLGSGLVIDVRMPSAFSTGALPAAVNVPVATFDPGNPYRNDLLTALGVQNVETSPVFGNAYSLLIYGQGPDDAQAAQAIAFLLAAGYPADKLRYYRGGAASWATLGLTLAVGQ